MNFKLQSENFLRRYPSRGHFEVQGRIVNIPSFYRGEGITAVFPISYAKACRLIDFEQIKPAKLTFNKALMSITVFDFKEGPVGPYKEVAFAILVLYKPFINIPLLPALFNNNWKGFGYYVIDLLQSTEIAIAHGKILSGYPHNSRVIDLSFVHSENSLSAKVIEGQEDVLSIESNHPIGERITLNKYETYFKDNGGLFKIQMDVLGIEQKIRKCKLNFVDNELTKTLKELEIHPVAIQAMYYPDFIEALPVTKDRL